MTLLFILAAGAFVFWAMGKGYLGMDVKQIQNLARTMGGYSLIGAGITLATTGKFLFALPVLLAGLWLMGFLKISGLKNWANANLVRQKSAMLDIALDPATGRISGSVTEGPYAGRSLDQLTKDECYRLVRDLDRVDPGGLRLFVAYLDGRFPGWREDLQNSAHPGAAGKARPGVMSDKEAYKILGLPPGADDTTIRETHRRLIQKLHPDVGGSDALAALVNEAKDVLLRRHN